MNFEIKPEREWIIVDWLKWVLTWSLILATLVANYYLSDQSSALRIVWNLVAMIAMLISVSFTEKGKRFLVFAKEAKAELHKVVWPTRHETMQSTFVIVIVVAVAALFLWGIDSALLWGMSFLTGQRG